MIAVLQRVSQGNVFIDNKIVASINHGLVIFLGVMNTDEKKDGDFLADKISDFSDNLTSLFKRFFKIQQSYQFFFLEGVHLTKQDHILFDNYTVFSPDNFNYLI